MRSEEVEIHTAHNGFNINLSLLRCVVENDAVRVVMMTTVRRLEVHLLATLVMAVAVMTAAVNMLVVICVAR